MALLSLSLDECSGRASDYELRSGVQHLAFRGAAHKVQRNSLPAIRGNSIPGNDFTPRVTRSIYIGQLSLSVARRPANRTGISPPVVTRLQFVPDKR